MTPAFAGTLVLLGFAGAFVSGLVGVGGAIVMIPLLYYAPPLLGVGSLPMPEVSGVTMVQVLAAAAVGAWIHGRHAAVQRELAVTGGAAMAAASLAGALASSQLSARALLIVFTLMATVALPLLAVRPIEAGVSAPSPEVSVPRSLAVGAHGLPLMGSGNLQSVLQTGDAIVWDGVKNPQLPVDHTRGHVAVVEIVASDSSTGNSAPSLRRAVSSRRLPTVAAFSTAKQLSKAS